MSIIYPELTEVQLSALPSQAEAKVYRALRDGLQQDFVVFFQVGWILRREEGQAMDGETDFVVCHQDHGYVCIEVKGGGVGFDPINGEWFSVDRNNTKHVIKNPYNQALKAKYSIRSKLSENYRWRELSFVNVLMGHAVFFPDLCNINALIRPDMPASLIGCAKDIQAPQAWVNGVFAYWGGEASSISPIGRRGVDVIRDLFARSFFVTPLISSQLADQEARRLVLTSDQMRVLDFLRSHRRVAVSGGAGTGKTVLALEKARRLAAEGFRTILTCYNRQLADHLASLCVGTANLTVLSFHQLCHRQVKKANSVSGRDLLVEAKVTYPGMDYYDVQLPNALGYSVEILLDRYDAIVCDEGQDFREDYWVPLELLLSDYEKSPFYIFYDDNQNLYSRASTFPICDEPFSLTVNCRNTVQIHYAAYRHYKGVHVYPPKIQGAEIQFDESQSIDSQAIKIVARIVDLISRQGVHPCDITILIADALHKSDYYAALKIHPLPRPAKWIEEGEKKNNTILIDTIQRFKGLESQIVILWGLDAIDLLNRQELLYVGMSRAKSILVIVGRASTCAAFKDVHAL